MKVAGRVTLSPSFAFLKGDDSNFKYNRNVIVIVCLIQVLLIEFHHFQITWGKLVRMWPSRPRPWMTWRSTWGSFMRPCDVKMDGNTARAPILTSGLPSIVICNPHPIPDRSTLRMTGRLCLRIMFCRPSQGLEGPGIGPDHPQNCDIFRGHEEALCKWCPQWGQP